MKECPTCRRCYEDNSNFCPIDGIGLAYSIAGPRLLGGKYRLERLIARGGMGAIYQAIQEGLSRMVAVKVLNPEFVNNSTALERFRREALAIAGLKHPNIVTIYDFGVTPAGSSFIAMEYLKGRPLSRMLEQEGKLSLERTLEIIEPICHALTEAHSKEIIHRDLKPDNIMMEQVGSTEVVKVVDFGLAKLKQRAEQRRITGNLVVGTFDYMSPEQCQSLELEATSDIYSLGIVIYEMLTGTVPFKGASRLATIYQHINDPPRPPRAFLPELPHEVEKVILKSLAKEPHERQLSAAEFFQEMRNATQVAAVPTKSRANTLRENTGKLTRTGEARKSPNATLKKHLVFEHFLGRERELTRLMTEFAFIRSGRAKPIIILGDAGVGKSQLITEFRRRLGEDAALFLSGRFFDYLGNTPYKPLLDALTTCLRGLDDSLFDSIFGEFSNRVRIDLNDDWQFWKSNRPNSGSLQGGPEGEKYRIFEYLAQVYIRLARHHAMVLWMDDMQWADGLSLNFLSYLLRRTLGEPIQFIFTARLQDVTQKGHPFQQWQNLATAARSIEQLQLPGLAATEIDQYLQLVFTDIELPASAIERFWQETQGNPYFLAEILRLLVDEEQILWTGQRWRYEQLSEISLPTSVVNIVDAHLRRFRENELDIFMQAAVLGEQFSFEELRLITGVEEDQLINVVETGLVGYVFKELPVNANNLHLTFNGADELYSFYHSTVRKVLYGKISTRRRRRLHQRVAESLEKFKKDRLEQLAPLLAHHYYHSEQYQLAFKYCVEAANAAWRALAIDEAEKFITRIEELLDQLPEAAALEAQLEDAAKIELADNLLAAALAKYRTLKGELFTSRNQFLEAERELFTALKLSQLIDDATVNGRAILAIGELYKERGDQERAIEFFQQAHAAYQKAGYLAGECQALNRMAWINYEQGIYQQASDYARHCVKLAQMSGDRLAEAGARLILAATDYRTGAYGSAVEGARLVMEIAQPVGDRVLERQAAALLGASCNSLGLYNQALTWLDQALAITRDTGARRSETRLLVEIGEVYRRQGRFHEAIDYFTRAYEIAVELRSQHEQEMALLSLGLVYKGLQYHEQASTYLRQAAALSQEVADPILIVEEKNALAELHALNNEFGPALKLIEKAIEIAKRSLLRGQLWQLLYLQGSIFKQCQQPQPAIDALQESVNILKAICADVTDESSRRSFLSDKGMVMQLLTQLKSNQPVS